MVVPKYADDTDDKQPSATLPDQEARQGSTNPLGTRSQREYMFMSTTITGALCVHFETGSEGTSWMLMEDDKTGWDGAHYIRNGDHLVVEILLDGGSTVLLDKKLEMVNTAGALKHFYLKQYVKIHETGLQQLSFAGVWMHYLPVNVDLGLWYRIFYELNDTQAIKATLTRSR